MAEFHELWPGGPLFAQAAHFRLGTDCVLLADFVNVSGAVRGIDLAVPPEPSPCCCWPGRSGCT